MATSRGDGLERTLVTHALYQHDDAGGPVDLGEHAGAHPSHATGSCRVGGSRYESSISATMKSANADQVVAIWSQLIVKYVRRPASQSAGIASGSHPRITL